MFWCSARTKSCAVPSAITTRRLVADRHLDQRESVRAARRHARKHNCNRRAVGVLEEIREMPIIEPPKYALSAAARSNEAGGNFNRSSA
jgi:hypothetical protein